MFRLTKCVHAAFIVFSISFKAVGMEATPEPLPYIPEELIAECFKFLDIKSFCVAKLTCKEWNRIANDDKHALYQYFYGRIFDIKSTQIDQPINWKEEFQKNAAEVLTNKKQLVESQKKKEPFPLDCSFESVLSTLRIDGSPANLQRVTARYAVIVKFDAIETFKSQRMGVTWLRSDFTCADLSEGDFHSTPILYARVENCNFSGANLSGVNLKGSSFSDNNLTGANLTRVLMDGSDGQNTDFTLYRGCYVLTIGADGKACKKILNREDLIKRGVRFVVDSKEAVDTADAYSQGNDGSSGS